MVKRGWRKQLGAIAEKAAAAWLAGRGLRIIETNYRCRLGEIDLVAEDREAVVFVEVKAKSRTAHGSPEEMLTWEKRRRITLLARHYLQRRGWLRRPARFDVVAVDWKNSRAASIRHYPNAFPASGGW